MVRLPRIASPPAPFHASRGHACRQSANPCGLQAGPVAACIAPDADDSIGRECAMMAHRRPAGGGHSQSGALAAGGLSRRSRLVALATPGGIRTCPGSLAGTPVHPQRLRHDPAGCADPDRKFPVVPVCRRHSDAALDAILGREVAGRDCARVVRRHARVTGRIHRKRKARDEWHPAQEETDAQSHVL